MKLIQFSAILVLLLLMLTVLASADAFKEIKDNMNRIICAFKRSFASIATGVAAFVMSLAGIQWIGSENDPGARKKAKSVMVHAIVGLILVIISDSIAGLVISVNCPP